MICDYCPKSISSGVFLGLLQIIGATDFETSVRMTLGHIQFVGIRKLLNILIPHKLPPQNVCSAIRCYHANEGMMGINKNDLKLYKTAYRDHPLRRRVDIQDDLHLWSMSNLQKSIINAEDIPLLSDIPFPPPFKSEIGNTKIRFPYPSKSIRSSLHPDDWMLTRVALHLGNISEVEADAIVVGTDSSMTKYQQTSQHLYTNPSLSIAESMGGISNGLSRFSKARDVPSMDDAAHTSMMRTKKGSKRTFPVGTVTQITNMNCNARATLLTVQPVIVDEKQYKLCVKNILDEMKRRQYRTLLLPILRLQGMRVTPYSGTRWTLEAISDWLAQENDELRMDVGYGKHNDAQSMDQPIQMDDDDDANDEIENQLLKERIENRTAEVGRMESKVYLIQLFI